MYKIANITKQIFRVLGNVPKSSLSSINSIFKYSTQSKGYIEDARDEFTFLKALPSQSDKASIQDKFKAFKPNLQNLENLKSRQLLDLADIRKLIYARFADEIAATPKKVVENKNLDTKDNTTREHAEACNTYDITEEFKIFKEQGYNFASAKKAIQNQSPKSIFERMKELSISGYLSNYAGYTHLREDVEKVIIQKALVIEEFMATITSRIEDPEEYSSELLG